MGGGEGRGFSIIKILWSIELNYLWSKKICRPKVIVWSGAAFIHSWSCIFNLVIWLGWFCAQLQVFYRYFISDHSTFYGSTKLNLKNQKPPRFLKCHIYCVLAKGVSFLTDEIQGKSNTDSRYNKIRKDILMAILHVSRSDLLIYSQQKKHGHNFPDITSELNQHWNKSDQIWKWYLENCGHGFFFLLTDRVLLIFSLPNFIKNDWQKEVLGPILPFEQASWLQILGWIIYHITTLTGMIIIQIPVVEFAKNSFGWGKSTEGDGTGVPD